MIKNLFYFHNLNKIGGVENFFYELAKKYHSWDIVVCYSAGDKDQINRLKKFVRVKQYKTNTFIECEKAFFNYNTDIIDFVNAKEYYMIIHADYKAQGITPITNSKITKYIGVSQAACDSFTELTGLPCQLCYNPFSLDPPTRCLHLVSATRLTKEKGKNRILQLAQAFDKEGIPYIWDIYTNDRYPIEHPNIKYKNPTLDINGRLAEADYVVQLSDSESYCYTMVQALSLGVPVIVTPWRCLEELGMTEEYGFILPFDMKDIPVKKIYEKHFKFEYTPPADTWNTILQPGASVYEEDNKYLYQVEALYTYKEHNLKDAELGYIPDQGYRWYVTKDRLDFLLGDNDRKFTMVKLIDKKLKEELEKI